MAGMNDAVPSVAGPADLRVLHLEDIATDAELVHELLAEEWPGCRVKTVQTRKDFLNAILSEPFNLILSDFSLPKFDGLSALAIAREHATATPFIFFSGAIGEERAIEALKRGAEDYVIKDRPGRLVSAIRQVLNRTQEIELRRQSAAELRRQASLLHKARDAILATDLRHRISFWNASAERLYGLSASEVLGRSLLDLGLGYDAERFGTALSQLVSTGEWRGDFRVQTRRGEALQIETTWSLVLDDNAQPESILHIDTDVTEKKRMEAQLLRADRMDSIGMLTGGVAHDLNNVLAPIVIGADLLRARLTDATNLDILTNIENSAQHGVALVRQLTMFARGGEGEHSQVDVAVLVAEVQGMLQQALPSNVQVTAASIPDLWMIQADPTQITQLLLNLCLNARDAMPDGGALRIAVGNTDVDEGVAAEHPGAQAGRHVVIEVRDTGTGIPPEILEKIFDPFFTTKGVGKGTGLGLSTVAGIVKSHGGFLKVESRVGAGTAFRLFLPAVPTAEKGES